MLKKTIRIGSGSDGQAVMRKTYWFAGIAIYVVEIDEIAIRNSLTCPI